VMADAICWRTDFPAYSYCHRHHRFEPGDGVARCVGVNGGHRAFVSGIHGLEHIKGFFATHLAMIIRSGRMRRQLIRSWRCLTAPCPSMLGGRVSDARCFPAPGEVSAASSMVTGRSLRGMYCDRIFKKVVLPAPVPPAMRMLIRLSPRRRAPPSSPPKRSSTEQADWRPADLSRSGGSTRKVRRAPAVE